MRSLSRMRTLDEAFRELKQLDPDTCISKFFLRQLALSGKVPTLMCGRKRLINFDRLLDYLSGDQFDQDQAAAQDISSII